MSNDAIDPFEEIPGTDFTDLVPQEFDRDLRCKKNVVVEGKIHANHNIYAHRNIYVTNDIFLKSTDCAEEFNVFSGLIDPGSVVVLKDGGMVTPCYSEYDKKVAGVISGAGQYKPGIILDKNESLDDNNRVPVALMGKVYCKVDADYASIETGDLLTTSNTEGHAMKSIDPLKAVGSIIGKALSPLKNGKGLIPILVTLQ